MLEWYEGLSTVELVYFYLSIVATVFLIIQIVLMCFSFAGGVDADGDGMADSVDLDDGISLFTVKGLTAFFAVGGWVGLAMFTAFPSLIALDIIVSVTAGFSAMLAVAFIMKAMLKLQCNGNVQSEKLVGNTASVYVTIQPNRTGRGKVTLNAQGRYMELDAVTDGDFVLNYGESVLIEKMENDTAVVSKEKK